MTYRCYDSINAAALPSGGDAYLAYVNGYYANYGAVKARFPDAKLIGVSVFPSTKALMIDDEPGDATNSQVAGWFPGDSKVYARPILYTAASNVDALVDEMGASGDNRSAYRLFSAHYTNEPHLCGPSTCGECRNACDATQWASNSSYDTSELSSNFFGDPVTSRWELWTSAGEESAMQMANGAGLKVSSWLRMQIVLGGEFTKWVSEYLGRGDLNAKFIKGTRMWALVKS